jgi:nucleoside-diphosphate-sugar epimerase
VIITVTGGAGFVGSHFVDFVLNQTNYNIRIIDNLLPNLYPAEIKMQNLQSFIDNKRVSIYHLDLRSDNIDKIIGGTQIVVHFAAMAGLPKSWEDFQTYNDCNILGTERLLKSSKRNEVEKFIHISTSSVYGSSAVGSEDAQLNPVSPYGVTKLASENLVRAYGSAFGLSYTILRLFSIYGPRQRPDMVYNIMIDKFIKNESFTVFGDGTQSRSNTYVEDVVKGILSAITSAGSDKIYNLAGSEEIKLHDAIRLVAEITGSKSKIEFRSPRIGDQILTKGNFEAAIKDFGYSPKITFENGITNQIRWQKSLIQ